MGQAGGLMARPKGRPKKATGEGTPVRLDSDIVSMARYLVARQGGTTLTAFLSDLLRPQIERQFKAAAKDVSGGEGRP
jgi:hypothetical protein